MNQRKLTKGQNTFLKQQKMLAEYRKHVRDLKCELTEKESKLQNIQRTMKFSKIKEFDV